jgi:tight adherence protein B
MIFVLIFVALVVITFSVVAFTLRPSPDQVAITKRMNAMLSPTQVNLPSEESILQVAEAAGAKGGWIEERLRGTLLGRRIRTLLLQSKGSTTMGRLLLTMLALGVSGGLLAYVLSNLTWVAGASAVTLGYMPWLRLQMRRSSRIKAFEKALPDSIEMCSRSLRAGHSLVGAIGNIAEDGEQPAREEFAEVFRKQNYGMPLRDALLQMLERVPSADLRVAVTGILVQKDTGGNLAEIMDNIAQVIRERVRIKGEIGVHTAQGRLTGYILCALPIFLLLAINVVSPGYSKMLFHEELGQEMLMVGVALLALGTFIIRRIINGIEV